MATAIHLFLDLIQVNGQGQSSGHACCRSVMGGSGHPRSLDLWVLWGSSVLQNTEEGQTVWTCKRDEKMAGEHTSLRQRTVL